MLTETERQAERAASGAEPEFHSGLTRDFIFKQPARERQEGMETTRRCVCVCVCNVSDEEAL